MIIKHNCVTLECDECGLELENGDGVVLHYPSDNPRMDANAWYEWQTFGELDWHEDCVPACVCGDLFGEHDMGEQPCEVDDCKCLAFKPRQKMVSVTP